MQASLFDICSKDCHAFSFLVHPKSKSCIENSVRRLEKATRSAVTCYTLDVKVAWILQYLVSLQRSRYIDIIRTQTSIGHKAQRGMQNKLDKRKNARCMRLSAVTTKYGAKKINVAVVHFKIMSNSL